MKYILISFFLLFAFTLSGWAQTAKAQLDSVIKKEAAYKSYDWEKFPLGQYEESRYEKDADFAQEIINDLEKISEKDLSNTEVISRELLLFKMQDEVDSFNYKMYLNPIQADQGFHLNLNYRVRPITDYDGATRYLNTLEAIPYFTDSQLALMRKGLKEGISQPKIIFEGYESTYNTHIVEDPKTSYFYSPLTDLPESFSQERKDSLQQDALAIIDKKVIPSFKKIKAFFETEYIPNTREAIGVSAQPGGAEFYQNRINYYTTSKAYTAQDIHDLGLKEVARIHLEMNAVIKEVGFEGTFEEFFAFLRSDNQFYKTSGSELLKEARDIAKRIDAQLPRFFKKLPRQPYGVKKVPDAIAPKYTGGRYSGSSIESTEPGWYLVNTYKLESRTLYTLPALTAHEAVPGHHLQGALNQEMGDSIPDFRKNLYLSGYGEGWGLYSEYLVDEMGIYTTPYEKFGQLTYEMWRACRLVVDTGIHAFSWTRDQVIDYMSKNTALSLHEINTETDRYIGWPGQALSYKIGELKIRELRKKAEQELGDKFDIRDFHEVILAQGTVTLPILEQQVNKYIESSKI